MANRVLTRDEVLVEVGIPWLRAAITAASVPGASTTTIAPNPMRDCLPLVIERSAVENGAAAEMLANLDSMERKVRDRIKAKGAE